MIFNRMILGMFLLLVSGAVTLLITCSGNGRSDRPTFHENTDATVHSNPQGIPSEFLPNVESHDPYEGTNKPESTAEFCGFVTQLKKKMEPLESASQLMTQESLTDQEYFSLYNQFSSIQSWAEGFFSDSSSTNVRSIERTWYQECLLRMQTLGDSIDTNQINPVKEGIKAIFEWIHQTSCTQ